jgi:hypothetical protein
MKFLGNTKVEDRVSCEGKSSSLAVKAIVAVLTEVPRYQVEFADDGGGPTQAERREPIEK